MNEENKIVIVSDNGNRIDFDDVTIKHDSVDRNEVADIKSEIADLQKQRASIDERLIALKAKISYAEHVIEIADAKAKNDDAVVEPLNVDLSANSVNEEV